MTKAETWSKEEVAKLPECWPGQQVIKNAFGNRMSKLGFLRQIPDDFHF
jgi:hypothetical protein